MVLKLFVLEADILGISRDQGTNPRKLIQLSPTTPCNGLLFEASISKCVVDPAEDSFSNENGKVFLIKNTYLKSENRIALLMQSIRACATRRARAIIVQVAKNPPTTWSIGGFVEAVLTLGESNSPNVKWVQFLGLCPELQELSHLSIPVCFMMEMPFDLLVSNRTSYIQVRPSETYIDGRKYDPPPLSRLLGDILSSNLPLLEIESALHEVLLGGEYIGDWRRCEDVLYDHCDPFNFPLIYSLSVRLGRKEGRNNSTSMYRNRFLKYVYEFSFTASALEMLQFPSIENDCHFLEQEFAKMFASRDTSSDRLLSLYFFLRCSVSARSFQLPGWETLLNSMVSVEGVSNMITKVGRAREKLSQQLPTVFSPQDESIALSVFARSSEEIKHLRQLLSLSWSSPHRDQIRPLVKETVDRGVKRMASRGVSHLSEGWWEISELSRGSDPILSLTTITDTFRKEILRGSPKLFMDCVRNSTLSTLLPFPDAMAHISEGNVDLVNAIDALDLFLERSAKEVHETILEVFQKRFQSFAKEKKLGETLLLVAQHWKKKCVQRTMTRVLDTLEVVPLPSSPNKIHAELVSAFSSLTFVDPGSDASLHQFVDIYIRRYLGSFSEHRNCSQYFTPTTSRGSYTENKPVRFLAAQVVVFLFRKFCLSDKLSAIDRFVTMLVNPKEELDILSLCSRYRVELSDAQFREFEGAPALLKTLIARENIHNYPLRTVQCLAEHVRNVDGFCRALHVQRASLLETTIEDVGRKCEWLTVEVKFLSALLTQFPECRFFIERDLRCFQLKKDEIMCMSWSDFEVQVRALEDVVNSITSDNRKFFECFESDGSSVLYRHYHHQITTAALNEIAAIATAADVAVYINTSLSKMKGCMEAALEKPPVDEIIRISKALEDNDRKVDDEFKLLCNLLLNQRDGQRVHSIVTEMNNVVKLFGLRQLLMSFALGRQGDGQACDTPTLQRLGFTCVTEDEYREMVSAVELIADAALLGSWKARECQQYLSTILTAFHLSDSPEELTMLRRLLHLFAKLGSASKLWEFFEENNSYIADDGRGYSRIFVDKVDDFLGELDGEDLKILENFKTVAGWTTTVMALTQSPFAEIMSKLKVSPTIVAHLESDVRGIPFKPIETVQKDMDFITTLFQVGLSSLDSVLGQLRSIQAASCYRFDLRTGQLTLEYYDDKRKTFITWKDDQLQDFEQRLGFVQQEPKAALMNIPAKLQEIRSMKASLDVLCQLHRRGHPKVVESVWAFPVGDQAASVFPPFPRKLGASTTKLQQQLQDWDQKIEQAMVDNSLLRLFSVEQLQRIASHIKANRLRQLTLSIIHVIAHSIGSWNDLVTQVQGAARHCTNARSDSDWLAVACLFFQTMREFFNFQTFDAPVSTCATRIKCSTRQGDIIRLLCALFPNEPPLAHQLLWGHPAMTESTLCDFLRRASAFPSTRFVLIRSDALSPSNQQVLLRALLKDIHLQQNLSCIECGGASNSLQAASWLSCAIAEDMCANARERDILRKWISKVSHAFTWIHGPPCSGKTHQLQKRIQQANTLIHLAVNEQMNWKDAIEKFQAVLQNESLERIDVVIQIHFGFFRSSERESLREMLRDVDIFLFNLLVLRSLQSSDLTLLVNLPPKMAVHVTMEVSDDVVCPVGGRGEMLPVMNHVSTFVDASQCEFEPDANAMHVSKYLKAYESGTIDSLYKDQGSAVEQIAFALDVSGSMAGSRLDICKNELRKIFASQIPPDSCVRFVAFESAIRVDVASAPWSPRHKQQVEYYLDSLSAGGGTSMWTALHNVITTVGATKKKAIVVALTDGEAGDESLAGTVKGVLQSNPQIRILFIGVQLEPQYADIIRSHCIRSKEDELFLAGQSSDLSAAWTSVGFERNSADI